MASRDIGTLRCNLRAYWRARAVPDPVGGDVPLGKEIAGAALVGLASLLLVIPAGAVGFLLFGPGWANMALVVLAGAASVFVAGPVVDATLGIRRQIPQPDADDTTVGERVREVLP